MKPVFTPVIQKARALIQAQTPMATAMILKKVNLMKYLHAKTVGILVSTKPGQSGNKINIPDVKMKSVLELINRKDKECYIFAFDTLDPSDLENFPFIECWVNTACPRITDEKKGIINLADMGEVL